MPSKTRETAAASKFAVELELLNGLLPFVSAELQSNGVRVVWERDEAVRVVSSDLRSLLNLRCVVAAYLVTTFDVPRPKALLGDQHFRRLLGALETVRALHPAGAFTSFRFGAAGSDSGVFKRLAAQLGAVTGLSYDPLDGDLLLRVRPSDERRKEGWEVLTRLSPRPLSARDWRVCNLVGGLNATVAVAMNALTQLKNSDRYLNARYLNAMCGSGTLLIERALQESNARLVGCDLDGDALACAAQNVQAAGVGNVDLVHADATALPFEDGSFDVVTADLPWGDADRQPRGQRSAVPGFFGRNGEGRHAERCFRRLDPRSEAVRARLGAE